MDLIKMSEIKRQFSKYGQLVLEKTGSTKPSLLPEEFESLQKDVKAYEKLLNDIKGKLQEYIKPKGSINLLNSSGSMTSPMSPPKNGVTFGSTTPEDVLVNAFSKYQKDMSPEILMGSALKQCIASFLIISNYRRDMYATVKQNLIAPMTNLQQTEMKQVNDHLKKLESHRLEYDSYRRRESKMKAGTLSDAQLKFSKSVNLSERAMKNFLAEDAPNVSALNSFISAYIIYEEKSIQELRKLQSSIESISDRGSFYIKTKPEEMLYDSISASNIVINEVKTQEVNLTPNSICQAKCDFVPKNEYQLGFKEGDVIKLLRKVDKNWFHGELHWKSGYIPVDLVEILNP